MDVRTYLMIKAADNGKKWTPEQRLMTQNILLKHVNQFHDPFPDGGGPFRDRMANILDKATNEQLAALYDPMRHEYAEAIRKGKAPILNAKKKWRNIDFER